MAIAKALELPDSYFSGFRADYTQKRDFLAGALTKAGFEVLPCAGTYFLMARTDRHRKAGEDDVAFCKRLLLDQNLVSGVGNIYADEALWQAQVHGDRPGERLTAAQVREVAARAHVVMAEALGQGGTSFDALYVNVNGESGYFDRSLNAYGREDEPCRRCGAPIRRVAFMNRSSYFCQVCQPVPRRRRVT